MAPCGICTVTKAFSLLRDGERMRVPHGASVMVSLDCRAIAVPVSSRGSLIYCDPELPRWDGHWAWFRWTGRSGLGRPEGDTGENYTDCLVEENCRISA